VTEQHTTVAQPSLDGLVDALDRIIDGGAAVAGDLIVSVDGIDLIRVDLRLLIAGIQGTEGATGS
jgi:hypothetical protein